MTNLMLAIRLIRDILLHNVRYALSRVSGPVENYLTGLLWLFVFGVCWPFVLALIGVWQGLFTFVGLLGVWSFVAMVFIWVSATPVGVAIDSLLSGPLTFPALWKRYQDGKLVTGEGYLRYGRTVLLYETFSLFFLSQVPINYNWRVSCGFILGVFFLVCSGWEWRGKFGYWAKPLIRVVMLVVVLCQFAYFLKVAFLPKVEPVAMVLLPATGTNAVTSLSDVDNAVLKATATGWVDWIEAHYTSPGFWIGFVLLAAFGTFAFWFLKKLAREGREAAETPESNHSASAQSPAHATPTAVAAPTPAHAPHGAGSGSGGMHWLVKVAIGTFIVMCLGFLLINVVESLRIAKENERRQMMEELRRAAAASAPAVAPRPATSETASELEPWPPRLINPKRYMLLVTTNWSLMLPRASDLAVHVEPDGYPVETRLDGKTLLRRNPGAPSGIPRTTRFLEFRLPDGITDPTNIVVAMGKITP